MPVCKSNPFNDLFNGLIETLPLNQPSFPQPAVNLIVVNPG